MKKYHAIVIGMGPAGMAVSAMGAAMGLDILAVEERKVGGECLNVGCIPSKALLKASEVNFSAYGMEQFGINSKLMMQHSFPTIAMINKMAEEDWMMKKVKNPRIGKIARFMASL